MNKVTKGALAAAAGAAILVGGAGTMAAWNDSASIGSGTVKAGELNIKQQAGTGTWKWANGEKSGAEFKPDTDLLAPGNQVVYTATYDITMTGTNMKATLTPSLSGATTGPLASYLAVSVAGAGETVNITGSGPKEVSTTVTFEDVNGKTGQGESASLAGSTITLQQVS